MAGVLHGLLLALAFPPLDLWPLVFAAVLPLAWVVTRAGRPGRAGLWAAVGVLPFWLWSHQWVIPITTAGYLPMQAHQALFTWLFVWVLGRAARRWPSLPLAAALPVVWVGVEFLRGVVLWGGYPWLFIGHPLVEAPGLAWPASWFGTYFVSFLVATVNGAVADVALARPRRPVAAAVAAGSAAAVFGVGAALQGGAGPTSDETVRIAVIQTNLPQSNKTRWEPEQRVASWNEWATLTMEAAATSPRPALIAWPETMFPGHFLDRESVAEEARAALVWEVEQPDGSSVQVPTTIFAERLAGLQGSLGVPMIVGAISADDLRITIGAGGRVEKTEFDARYNSAFLVRAGRVEDVRYDKISLTPFGEVMPGISRWDWLERQMLAIGASGMSFDLSAGTRRHVFEIPATTLEGAARLLRFATPICFEIIRPDLCRELVFGKNGRRADMLVNLSNYGWFTDFDAAREHALQLSRLRAIELGTPIVVVANTGISAGIDARGRVLKAGVEGESARSRVTGVLLADVPLPGTNRTLYSRVGDIFGWVVFASAIALGGWTFVPLKRRMSTPSPS